ncbi:response regulator [Oribacterium sp. WCC10]|uniref:response regulator n=1 Tax=Oribacterium sp. WCC10 TaxID=1855343 RepID=UPI0008E7D4F1|nr:response regulator [Oribacterium sp. WCC10]SFG61887.1 Signal transduction histidine kinase [Oribacterium sp. WCC10]
MEKFREKLRNLNHYGYDPASYEISRNKVIMQAYQKCLNFTKVFQYVMAAFTVLSLMGFARFEMLPEYLGFFLLLTFLRIYYHINKEITPGLAVFICRGSIFLLLVFGIIESASDTQVVATAILALYIVTAVVFTDSMLAYIIICFITDAMLIASSFMVKSGSLARGDVVNGTTFAIVAISIHYFTQRERIAFFVTSYQLSKLREEQLQNEISVAQESNKAKSIFLSKMSHEIRTPINAILGMNEMILREYDDPQLNEYATNIQSSGQTLLSLINDILDFSKIEASKLEIIPVNYELSALINDIVNMVSVRAQQKALTLNINVSPDIPNYLYGDDIRIRQCVLNILTNAVKYTEQGSVTLNITSKQYTADEIFLRFCVVDTGIGIKSEDIEKLFSPFERIEEDRNRSIEGTGLGMNITKHLLALMGTHLEVSSVYGEGSDFSFEIRQGIIDTTPIGDFKVTHKAHLRNKNIHEPGFISPEGKVLVIDDNAMNLKVITGLLKETRLMVDTAQSGFEGLEKVCTNKYDCIFVDHLMPKMDGIETLKQMKSSTINKNPDVPYIALTANAISGAREEYLAAGFDDYLSKPVDPVLLEAQLMKYLPAAKMILPGSKNFDETIKAPKAIRRIGYESGALETEHDSISELLESVTGIDLATALSNTGTKELLFEIVKDYRAHITKTADKIESEYQDKDWENFTIDVHALKSTSRIIGAIELSEMCQKLETAGKASDISTIETLTDSMLDLYRSYLQNLSPLDTLSAKTGDIGTEGTAGYADEADISASKKKEAIPVSVLNDILTDVKTHLEDFDYTAVEETLARLDEYKLSDTLKGKISEIREALDNLDAEIATEIIDSMST